MSTNMILWFKNSAIRAIKTAAQAALAVLSGSFLLSDVSWILVLSAAAFAFVYSMLTSLAGIPEVESGTSPLSKEFDSKDNTK